MYQPSSLVPSVSPVVHVFPSPAVPPALLGCHRDPSPPAPVQTCHVLMKSFNTTAANKYVKRWPISLTLNKHFQSSNWCSLNLDKYSKMTCTGWPNKNHTFFEIPYFAATTDIIMRFWLKCSEITAENNKRQFFKWVLNILCKQVKLLIKLFQVSTGDQPPCKCQC